MKPLIVVKAISKTKPGQLYMEYYGFLKENILSFYFYIYCKLNLVLNSLYKYNSTIIRLVEK